MNFDSKQSLEEYPDNEVYNCFRILNQMAYGTKTDFINDKMEECLEQNIISYYASDNNYWANNDIQIIDNEYIYMNNPYVKLIKGNEQKKWKFDTKFKKVILPKNYKLIKCPAKSLSKGKHIAVDSVSLMKDNCIVRTFTYFGHFNLEKSKLEILNDMLENINNEKGSKLREEIFDIYTDENNQVHL